MFGEMIQSLSSGQDGKLWSGLPGSHDQAMSRVTGVLVANEKGRSWDKPDCPGSPVVKVLLGLLSSMTKAS